jgi:hypothetical protein
MKKNHCQDIKKKILQMTGNIKIILKSSQVQKQNRLKIYEFCHYLLYDRDKKIIGRLENRKNTG